MSVVLGVLLALSVAMALEVMVMDAMLSDATIEIHEALEKVWCLLPLGICDVFYLTVGSYWQNVLMVTLSIMTVGIFVRMSGTKNSRTKILQAVATALLALLLMLAYRHAFHSWVVNGVLALVPVVLMVIPLTILRKTQQPFEAKSMMVQLSETWDTLGNRTIDIKAIKMILLYLFMLVMGLLIIITAMDTFFKIMSV